jgi:hypothetical protein
MKARRRRKMAAYEYSLEKNFHFNLLLSFLWMSRDSLVAVLSRYLKGHRHSFGVERPCSFTCKWSCLGVGQRACGRMTSWA